MEHLLSTYISDSKLAESLKPIVNKVLASERISVDETIELYEKAEKMKRLNKGLMIASTTLGLVIITILTMIF